MSANVSGYTYHDTGSGSDFVAQIWICQYALQEQEGICTPKPQIASTILHELVHEACYNGDNQEKDMAYGCEYSCFGGKDTEGSKRCRQGR